MRDDVFTETIIKVRGIVDSRFVIDEFAGWVVGKDFFENKEIDYIWIYFSEAGGECRKNEPGSGELMCELDRKWKYKNIGADSDPVTWCVPGLKLMYKFKFSTERDGKDYWSDLEFGTESSTICPELFIE
ncbi:hypothetical protein A7D25_03810 [Pseudomonas sp. 21C1]|nr:hypothetical protein A7D25_03810 [Pseudomonas sp. 21C1]